jgi:hypothetical protein
METHRTSGVGKLNSGEAPHRAGAAAAVALLRSSDAPRWRRAAARAPALLQQRHYTVLSAGAGSNYLNAPGLCALRAADAASGHVVAGAALPALLGSLGARLHRVYELTHADLLAVVSLKHSLMQWRPNLRHFFGAAATAPCDVQRITGDALEVLHGSAARARAWSTGARLREALALLCSIGGVGPATAALICGLAAPETACFVVDEVLSAWSLHCGGSGLVQGCRVQVDMGTAQAACDIACACRAKARELNALEAAAAAATPLAALPPVLPPWTCLDVQMTIWAAWQLGARGEGGE